MLYVSLAKRTLISQLRFTAFEINQQRDSLRLMYLYASIAHEQIFDKIKQTKLLLDISDKVKY